MNSEEIDELMFRVNLKHPSPRHVSKWRGVVFYELRKLKPMKHHISLSGPEESAPNVTLKDPFAEARPTNLPQDKCDHKMPDGSTAFREKGFCHSYGECSICGAVD